MSQSVSPTARLPKIIDAFTVHGWLAALMAVSFAGAAFGFGGLVGALGGFIIAGVAGFFSLSMAYNKREHKDAFKSLSDGVAIAGMVIFLVLIFSIGLITGLIVLLLFLHIALNFTFREHRQVYFGLLINFIALMTGAVNTFSAGYLFFMLAFCVCACFYMAVAFIDRQQYALLEETEASLQSLPSAVQHQLSTSISSSNSRLTKPLEYAGEWKVWDKLLMAGMISLIAGLIYLISPQFPAGNLGSMPIVGFGQYDKQTDLADQILPAGTDIDDHFYSPKSNNPQGKKPENADKKPNQVEQPDKTGNVNNNASNNASNNVNNHANESNDPQKLDANGESVQPDLQSGRDANGLPLETAGHQGEPKAGYGVNSSNATNTSNTSSASNTTPAERGGLFGGLNGGGSNKNEDGFFCDPDDQLDNDIFYYIKSDKPRYMQIDTATYFDGESWHRLQYGWHKLPNNPNSIDFVLYPDKPNASVGVTVIKEPQVEHLLTTDNTVGIRFPSRWVASDYYDQLKTGDKLKVDTSYELMLVDKMGEKTGRMIDSNQASPDAKDLQLPQNLDARIKQLGDTITASARTNVQKANELEQHLRTSYEYTLDTVPNQNNIPLADFLFGSQRGHCENFATAMAVMLRQQGIPARMITGYVAHDYNPITGFYEVKGTNGHAWVAAYVDGEWAIYEATGAYNSPHEDAEKSQQTRNTNEIIKDYLEQVNEQDERLEEVQELTTWQKIQLMLRTFWYMMVSGLSAVVTILKVALPWLLGFGIVMGVAAWLGGRYWQSKADERADKQGLSKLKKLGKQTPNPSDPNYHEQMKTYIHEHLQIYQAMLARNQMPRPIGQQVESFAHGLVSKQLATPEQARMLIEVANGEFYQYYQSDQKHRASSVQINDLLVKLYEKAISDIQR